MTTDTTTTRQTPTTSTKSLHTLMLHGDRLRYIDEGHGPAIVLLHGLLGSHHNWAPQIESLSKNYRVIAPDLFGHGLSDKPNGDYSLSAHAATVRDLLDSLGIKSATFAGHSFGGGVAMQAMYLFPGLVERLVLVASGGLGQEVSPLLRAAILPGSEFVLPIVASQAVRTVTDKALEGLGRIGLSRLSTSANEAWQSFASVQNAGNRRAFLATARSVIDVKGQCVSARSHFEDYQDIQALLIWGERDGIIPMSHTENLRQELPSGRVEIFPGAGHFPHLDDTERFDTVFAEFMADCAVDARRTGGTDARRASRARVSVATR